MRRLIIRFINTKTGEEESYITSTMKDSQTLKTFLQTIDWVNPEQAVKELEKMGFIISYLKLDDDSIIERGNPKGGITIEWE